MWNEKRLMILSSGLILVFVAAIAYQGFQISRLETQLIRFQNPDVLVESKGTSERGVGSSDSSRHSESATPSWDSGGTDDDAWSPFGFSAGSWDPFEEMKQIQRRMDRMFDSAFQRFHASPQFGDLAMEETFSPDIDLSEENGNYVAKVDLPGMDISNIDIQVKDSILAVSGKREETVEEKDGNQVIRR